MNFVTFLFYFPLLINHHDDSPFTSMGLAFINTIHSLSKGGYL